MQRRSSVKLSFFIFLLLLIHITGARSDINITELNGGSVQYENKYYGIIVNSGSSLYRKWVAINDDDCPIKLSDVGINISYRGSKRSFFYIPVGSVECRASIVAFEIRFILFDVWGEHITTLSATKLTDIVADSKYPIKEVGDWLAWENNVAELLTVVTFVSRVREKDGGMWTYNTDAIIKEIESVRLQLSEEFLIPSKKKE